MILKVTMYGNPILRKKCQNINSDYKDLSLLIRDMWETLDNTGGIGLAAPQINHSIRLFLIKTNDVEKVFINAEIISYGEKEIKFTEGCLSIPGINGDVIRPDFIKISYYDEDFIKHEEEFSGLEARVIQHEYDHIEGKLFIDYLSSLKKRMIKSSLNNIVNNKVIPRYPIIYN